MLFKLTFFNLLFVSCIQFGTNLMANEYGKFTPSSFSETNEVVLVVWNSEEGIKRLLRSKCKQDFYQLVNNFQPQLNPLYCGIATSVIILNSLRIPENIASSQPKLEIETPMVWGKKKIKFASYSQVTFLNEKTDKIKHKNLIELKNITEKNTNDATKFDPGLTILQLKEILEVYDLNVKFHYADIVSKKNIDVFRKHITETIASKYCFLVVNFYGKALGTITNGHISPLAAYDKKTDSVLILDVATHKNPWYWAPISHLYRAMNIKDGNNFRGWLIIEDSLETN